MKTNKVWTADGLVPGVQTAWVGKNESTYNPINGTAAPITQGKQGVDNQPSGVQEGDENIIFGNDTHWGVGAKFSDLAYGAASRVHQINKKEDKIRNNKHPELSSLSKTTAKLNLQELAKQKQPDLDYLNKLADQQKSQHQYEKEMTNMYNCGKSLPRYNTAKKDTLLSNWLYGPYTTPTMPTADNNWFQNYTLNKQLANSNTITKSPYERSAGGDTNTTDDKISWLNKAVGKIGEYFKHQDPGAGKVSNSSINRGYAVPALLEWQMLNRWNKEQPMMPNTYAANRYAGQALQRLNQLKIDPYSQINAARQADRQGYYRISQAGGYTGGQRQNARIASALGTGNTIANILANTQQQNNQYASNWAQQALAEGNADAQRRQTAAQYGWESYNKAYGNKIKGIESHLANLGNIWQARQAQLIKNKQYGDTIDIYQQQLNNDQLKILAAMAAK